MKEHIKKSKIRVARLDCHVLGMHHNHCRFSATSQCVDQLLTNNEHSICKLQLIVNIHGCRMTTSMRNCQCEIVEIFICSFPTLRIGIGNSIIEVTVYKMWHTYRTYHTFAGKTRIF
jgi:hypothetical protein